MTPSKGKRAVLYTRVSTEEQAKEGFSLAAQLDKLRAYAKIHSLDVIDEFVDDGHSARSTKRPGYQALMGKREAWDVLITLKLDRIHRNSKNFISMMETLEAEGKEFASVMENLDTSTAMGRFVADIICRIGQLESEQIGERVTDGMTQKAKQKAGGNGGPAPFGYRWEEGKLIVVPEEAKIVRRIFSLGKGPHTPTGIALALNKDKLTTRQGKKWTFWNVRAILENPTYKGDLHWDGIVQKKAHEPLAEV